MKKASCGLSVMLLVGTLTAGRTWVDFATPGLDYSVSSAAYRADLRSEQVSVSSVGLTVRVDADKEEPASPWFTMGIPTALGGTRDWRNARFELVLLDAPSGRCRSDIALNFTDEQGETFQFIRKSESYDENGEFRLLFDLAETRPGRGWGGTRPNNVVDGALRFTALNVHFNPLGKDMASRRGDATFRRIEACPADTETAIPRTVSSREPISTDTTYPGARPFHGPESLAFVVDPAVDGPFTLTLSYGSSGTASQGHMTNFAASASRGRIVFDVALPYVRQYEFMSLVGLRPARIVTAEGVFRQTAAEAMRMCVETGNPLGLVRDGKDERPTICVRNPSESSLRWATRFVLSDFFGRKVEIPFDNEVAAGGEVRVDVPWPLPGRGVWRVGADVVAPDGSRARHEARFAWIDLHERTPYMPKPKFRMGIHYHGTHYLPDLVDPTIDALVAAGAKFARTDYSLMWSDIEKEPGVYSWEKGDRLLRKMRAAGLALDVIFAASPGWAVTPEWRARCAAWEQAGRRIRWGVAPTRPGLFRAFCEKFARRYGAEIDYYETGNEWDLSGEGFGPPEELLRMQREAYEGIHAGYPGACVTPNGWAGVLSPSLRQPLDWNTGLIELFAQHPEWYDGWALHCHGEPARFQSELHDRFLPFHAAAPFRTRPWLCNETALTSCGGREDDVAVAVWQKILYAWAQGSADYIWYNLRATGWFDGPEPGYGLMTADLRPRAGYAAFAALTKIFHGLDRDAILHSSHGGQLFRFRGRSDVVDGYVLAGWRTTDDSPGGTTLLAIRTDAKNATIADVMGNRRAVALRDGCVTFPLGRIPQALLLDGATYAEVVDGSALAHDARRILMIGRRSDKPAPDLKLVGAAYVRDLFEANPARVHRLWKGVADHAAKFWFWRTDDTLHVRAVVYDDVSAAGDGVVVSVFDAAGDARRDCRLERRTRKGTADVYEGALRVRGETFGLDVRVDDDDGEGVESRLELCKPGEPPVRCAFTPF